MNKHKKTNYLIIGNSAGGINAAEAIREVDRVRPLTIISDEPYSAYSRPMISEYLVGKCLPQKMLYRSEDFYGENGIHAILGRKVIHLDVGSHTIELEDGEKIEWNKLLLATGGQPIIPTMEGIECKGVFTFVSLDDSKAIKEYVDHNVQQVVVIGGGLIGVSVTEALVDLGLKVTIVEMKERLLNTMLDEETSIMVESRLDEAGIRIMTGQTVVSISSSSGTTVSGVKLGDGTTIPCQMVVVAIGVRPRIGLAIEAGIKTARGVIVDRSMATSVPDIYACGDTAEAYDFIFNENRPTPIWPNACLGGRVAGLNMAGVKAEYPGGTSMNSLKYFGLSIVSAGMVIPLDDSYEVLSNKYNRTSKKIILKNGCIEGMLFVGDIERAGIVFNLMKNKVSIDSFKQSLVTEDFSLACLPEEVWRPRLELPLSLVGSITAIEPQPEEMVGGE